MAITIVPSAELDHTLKAAKQAKEIKRHPVILIKNILIYFGLNLLPGRPDHPAGRRDAALIRSCSRTIVSSGMNMLYHVIYRVL